MFAAKNELLTRPSGGFVIPRSLRFRASATAYLDRTVATTGNTQKATWSGWVKRGAIDGTARGLLVGDDGAGQRDLIRFNTTEKLSIALNDFISASLITTQVFRDPSAWYHIVVAVDTTQATAADRIKLYINGVQVTAFDTATYPSQNYNFLAWNVSGKVQNLGASSVGGAGQLFDGYMAEVYWIDGQQLAPTSFGVTNTITGVWSPINYGGTYGTNGYHLTFNSYATTAALGTDTSGNSNTWTVNNCSVTAGVTYDSMIDVPTVTDTGSNYCVWNPLDKGSITVSGGNLNANYTSYLDHLVGTVAIPSTGSFCWEVTIGTGSNAWAVAIVNSTMVQNSDPYAQAGQRSYASNGRFWTGSGTNNVYGATFTTGDVIGMVFNAGSVECFKNGTSQGVAITGLTGTWWPAFSYNDVSSWDISVNFGQRAFAYPNAYGSAKALNTYNLAAPSILKGNLYMDATTYTGTGASLSVTNAGGFQPDFVWMKSRSAATDHALYDSVRGTTKDMASNTSNAETTEATGLTAFGSTGFTIGALAKINTNAATYVGWQWKGGGAAVSNTSGTITSSVSANTAAGQSIVTYTGNGSAGATIGHGLGVAPSFIIAKCRGAAGEEWPIYHVGIGATNYMYLSANTPAAANATFWNNTAPTSSVFSVGTNTAVNYNAVTMLAYCFATIAGYSAFGSYTGNNLADGPFVYLGFRARWVMIKRTDAGTQAWWILDTVTGTYNVMSLGLAANDSAAESSGNTWMDITANGFKIRQSGVGVNGSGATYIYAAFAENPFNNSLAR